MIFCFKFSNASVCSSVHFQTVTFLSNRLKISLCVEKFSMYLDRCWIAPKYYFNSFSLSGFFSAFIARSLSGNGLIQFWPILCPIHSISVLNNSDLFSLNRYPAFSSLVSTSISSSLCFCMEPFVTTMISSSHARCLLSSVWSNFS